MTDIIQIEKEKTLLETAYILYWLIKAPVEYLAESTKMLNVITGLRIVNSDQVNLVKMTLVQNSSYNSIKRSRAEYMGSIAIFKYLTE